MSQNPIRSSIWDLDDETLTAVWAALVLRHKHRHRIIANVETYWDVAVDTMLEREWCSVNRLGQVRIAQAGKDATGPFIGKEPQVGYELTKRLNPGWRPSHRLERDPKKRPGIDCRTAVWR